MTRIHAHGPRSVEEVWERYTRPSLWPTWAPQIRHVVADAEVVAPGVHGTVHGPVGIRLPFRILDVDDAARTWTWRVGAGPAHVVMDHGVEAVEDGARAWVRVRLPLPLAAPYLPLAHLALRRLVAA